MTRDIEWKGAAAPGSAIIASAIGARCAAAARALRSFAASARTKRVGLLAASVAVAAATGAMAGALGASGLMRPAAAVAAAPTMLDETRALQSAITQLRTELAALKTSIEIGAMGMQGQLATIAERFDRFDHARAVDARDSTGSVATPQQALAMVPMRPPSAAIVPGWTVRDVHVYRGSAIIQGGGLGMIEVEPSDTVPGVGRVDAIRKQDGRWVVVTAGGLITSPNEPAK